MEEKLIKYPRTWHIPQSNGNPSDDKTFPDISHLIGKYVVITEMWDELKYSDLDKPIKNI